MLVKEDKYLPKRLETSGSQHFLKGVSENMIFFFTNGNSHDMTKSFQTRMGNSMLNKSKQILLL